MIFEVSKETVCRKAFLYVYDSIIILWTICLQFSFQHTWNKFELFSPEHR